jgi:uncharacterized OB-fold protein
MPSYRKMAAPTPDPESQPFWDAARAGKFLVRKCNGCGKVHWYPRSICPFCASADTVWTEGSGKGTIYTYTVMRRAKDGPYAVAYVELQEGPKMLTNIVDCDVDSIEIGQEVSLVFVPTTEDGPPVPCFRPV